MSKPITGPELHQIAGLSEIAGKYDALLCDIWGVVHNGREPYPHMADSLRRFRAERGPVILISNAPRPSDNIPEQFAAIGVPADTYDAIVTSGDASIALINAERLGPACVHIGPDRDLPLFDHMSIERVSDLEGDFALCTGLFDDETEEPEDYRDLLEQLLDRGLVMVCANPDIVVMRGDKLIYCAGAVAALYEQMGGEVRYAGKPHAPIYERCLARAAEIAGKRVTHARTLAVGDGLKTDIRGANNNGFDALLIAGGIHREEFGNARGEPDPERIKFACAEHKVWPQAVMPHLVW